MNQIYLIGKDVRLLLVHYAMPLDLYPLLIAKF